MQNLHHLDFNFSATKQKAIEDARKAQAAIVRECADAGKEPPPYLLAELIGKGSFGRVYKATGTRTKPGQLVAVKIISIEEGDTLSPGAADTFNDILKEVNTLKLLSSGGARNINIVVDSLLVGQSVWIITEYCAGGSVASLMRPTGGLPEKWIIPILREVAEAVYWVHRQGIIHRDIKCANVLVTEVGGVQLCDFGVAGIMETKFDKRSTVTGTLQWMAPELFDSTVSYGIEVDIWAFGSMAYEVASGLPPNATTQIDIPQFGSYLKQYCPRLEGDKYSEQLKSLVAFCMVDDPKNRPPIEQIQRHPYIFDTHEEYPTNSLSKLVSAYRLWEHQGGSRRSLFSAGGAQGTADEGDQPQNLNDEWDFDDGGDDGQIILENPEDAQAVYDVYGLDLGVPPQPTVTQNRARRRRPPPNMKQFKAPLEKVFDPNTLTNYGDNSRAYYGREPPPSPLRSDLPLRETSEHSTVRESLIDLDAMLDGSTSRFGDLETIKPVGARPVTNNFGEFDRRKTQDWTFPAMAASMSAGSDTGRFQPADNFPLVIESAPPTRVFHPTEDPSGNNKSHRITLSVPAPPPNNRASSLSLIDLDACVVDEPEITYSFTTESPDTSFSSNSYANEPNLNTMSFDSTSFTTDSNTTSFDSTAFATSNRESNMSLIDLDASFADITRPSTAGSYTLSIDTAPMGQSNRTSNLSLIDLDASVVSSAEVTRPSTAGSYTTSPGSVNESTPFDLEFEARSLTQSSHREPSMYIMTDDPQPSYREPSMYVMAEDTQPSYREPTVYVMSDDPQPSYREPSMYIMAGDTANSSTTDLTQSLESLRSDTTPSPSPPRSPRTREQRLQIPALKPIRTTNLSRAPSISEPSTVNNLILPVRNSSLSAGASSIVPPLPPLPSPPSANVLQGMGSREELKDELQSMIASLNEHLQHTAECLGALAARQTAERARRQGRGQGQGQARRWGNGSLAW